MFVIIKEVFALPYAQDLAFKWWTAAYFLHGLDRFSTDIDLEYRGSDDTIDIYEDLATIARKFWTVKRKKHLLVSYKSWFDNIKIDLSRKIWQNNEYETVNFYGTDIIVQEKATLVSNKLVACLERSLNRDLYDSYYFLKQWFALNSALIYERTGLVMQSFWEKLEKRIDALWLNHSVLDGLGEVLDDKQKLFVKNELLTELLGLIAYHRDFS